MISLSRHRTQGAAQQSGEFERAFRESFAYVMREYGMEPRSDYQAGGVTRYIPAPRGVSASGSGHAYHIRDEFKFLRMIERSRQFDRDNMVVAQGVNRLVANVMQTGFLPDPDTGDKSLDDELMARWNEWACDAAACDIEGDRTFDELEAISFRASIVDGDVLAVATQGGHLEFIEAHQLRTPDLSSPVFNGIEVSGSRRVAAWVVEPETSQYDIMATSGQAKRLPFYDDFGNRQVMHLYEPSRFRQYRGITKLAPTVVPVSYHDDLQFAQLVKAKVASFYAVFREYEGGGDYNPRSNRQRGERTTDAQTGQTFEKLMPGAEVKGDPGEKLQGFAPNIPNPEFFTHANLILTFIAINLDLPLAVLLLDPSKTNFSGWRGAIDQARLRFRQIQSRRIRRFNTPVWRWKIRNWMLADPAIRRAANRSDVRIFAHTWTPAGWSYIEPVKDVTAQGLRANSNLGSQRRILGEQGIQWDTESQHIIADRATLIRRAKDQVSQEGWEDVDWREVAYGPPTGVRYNATMDFRAVEGSEGSNDDQQ